MSYTVKFTETERRLWLSGMELGWWSLGWCLVVMEFQSGKMKRFWRQMVVMAAPQSECTSCCWTVHLKMGTGVVLGFVYFTFFFFFRPCLVLVVNNPPANAGDARNVGLTLGLGRFPGEGNRNPLLYSCLESPMDRRAWWVIVQSMGLQKVRHNWVTNTCMLWDLSSLSRDWKRNAKFLSFFLSFFFFCKKMQGNISCKDGHNKGQKWYGPNRSRKY